MSNVLRNGRYRNIASHFLLQRTCYGYIFYRAHIKRVPVSSFPLLPIFSLKKNHHQTHVTKRRTPARLLEKTLRKKLENAGKPSKVRNNNKNGFEHFPASRRAQVLTIKVVAKKDGISYTELKSTRSFFPSAPGINSYVVTFSKGVFSDTHSLA